MKKEHTPLPGRPIFIGGDGRSGTTLVNVVLDSHPALAVGPELHFKGPKNLGPYALDCIQLIEDRDVRIQGSNLASHPDLRPGVQFVHRVERAGIRPPELRQLILSAQDETNSQLETFEEKCRLVNKLGEAACLRDGKSRWGFKIMRHIRNVGRYARNWPDAQFLHIIRDGRDVAASQMLEHGSWGYGEIEAAAAGWVRIIEESRANRRQASLLEFRYEDLVLEPESTLRRILTFLQVEWDDAVLRHNRVDHAFFDSKTRHPSREATKRPINSSAVGRYRQDLPAEQIRAFERVAGHHLKELGYSLS